MCQTMSDKGYNNSEKTSVTYLGDKGVRQENREKDVTSNIRKKKKKLLESIDSTRGKNIIEQVDELALSGTWKETLFWPLLLLEKGEHPNSPGGAGAGRAMGASAWYFLKSALLEVWRWEKLVERLSDVSMGIHCDKEGWCPTEQNWPALVIPPCG